MRPPTSRWLAALVLLAAACGGQDHPADGSASHDTSAVNDATVPSVVVTINILGDVVTDTLGDLADVTTLMPTGADPHAFEISAGQAERLERADAVITNGLDLEEAVLPLVRAAAASGIPVLETAPLLDPLPYGDTAVDEDAGTLDGHVWTDPARYAQVPGLVVEFLIAELGLDADTATAMRAAAAAQHERMRALDAEVETILAVVPDDQRKLVTNHHVFNHFAARYGFEILGAAIPGGTTLASPSAADLAELVGTINAAGVRAIFADASSPSLLVDALASEADLDVDVVALWTESLAGEGSGAETYAAMMRTNARAIAAALGP